LQRGRCLVIEDIVPLRDVPLELSVPEEVTSATLIPQGTELAMERDGGKVRVTVPEVECHQAVVFGY
ncbi:MAG TPA: beta-galactosidase, partial [Armatimonadota bacterium]|nr:beta-galactosidase [Armatimonadota bacterium]